MNNKNTQQQENPILSLISNIVIPVLILRKGSGWLDNVLENYIDTELVNINTASIAFFIALLFPFIYFYYDLNKRKNVNFISIIGFVNVLLTGGIGIFGAQFGLSKNWFIIKEGSLPLVIGFMLWMMSKFKKESFNAILLNEIIFDTEKIRGAISDNKKSRLQSLSRKAGFYLIIGFFISSIIQFILASLIVISDPGHPDFNKEVSTMTWVSYFAVMIPTILVVGKGYLGLISDLEDLTKLNKEDFLRT